MLLKFGIFICFVFYIAFWIQLPGMFFSETLLSRKLTWSTRILAGFFMGFTVLAIIYYVESALHIPYMIAAAGPLLSIAAIINWVKNKKPLVLNACEKIRPTFYIIFIILFTISSLGLCARYGNALDGNTTVVYHDFLFHTGNIVSLSKSFPSTDIRVMGVTLYYHYFMELLFAMCKHIFGMNAFELYMEGNALVCAWPLALALYSLGERIRLDRDVDEKQFFFYCFGPMISCVGVQILSVAYAREVASWTNNHLIINANALGFAVSLVIIILDILVDAWYKKFSIKTVIAYFLLMIAVTGFKGPTGLLLVAISASVFIVESIIIKKFSWSRFIYVVDGAIAFIITYLLVVAGFRVNGNNNHATYLSTYGTLRCSAISSFLNDHFGVDYTSFPGNLLCILLCILFIMGPSIVMVIMFSLRRFKEMAQSGEVGNIYDWFVIGSIIISWLGFVNITIEGMSQAYLIVSVVPLVFYASVKVFEKNNKLLVELICYGTWGLGILLILVDTGLYSIRAFGQNEIFYSNTGDRSDRVSEEMMEGYLWLRDNTEEDVLIAVDILSEELDYRNIYFYCGAFAERQCYLEGFDYTDVAENITNLMEVTNEKFFSDDGLVAEYALEHEGIDYLVVSNEKHRGYIATTDRLERVFINSEVKIYRFK